MPRIGDEGQRYMITATRCDTEQIVEVVYFGPPADGLGIDPKTGAVVSDDPSNMHVAAALKEMMRAWIILGTYKRPEIHDRKTGESAPLKIELHG